MNNRHNWSKRRTPGISIPVGKNILFIYCGERTELNYFKDVADGFAKAFLVKSKNQTRLNVRHEVDIVDPLNMSKDVLSIIKRTGENFDEVWVVFDKDDFPNDNFDNAIKSIASLNRRNKGTKYYSLWSNECIELWFVLHFEYLQSSCRREDYYAKLSHYFGKKYEKNNKNIHNDISKGKGNTASAIRNAHNLLVLHKDDTYSNKCPATNVVELFDKYFDYIS